MNTKSNNNKSTGFKIPSDYFENFEERLSQRIRTSDSSDIPKEQGFELPKGYFESFENRLKAKIESKPKGKLINLKKYFAAASVAVAATLVLLMVFNIKATTPISLAEVNTETIDFYIENEDYNAYDLAQNLDLTENNFVIHQFIEFEESNLNDYIIDTYDTEDLINYNDE